MANPSSDDLLLSYEVYNNSGKFLRITASPDNNATVHECQSIPSLAQWSQIPLC